MTTNGGCCTNTNVRFKFENHTSTPRRREDNAFCCCRFWRQGSSTGLEWMDSNQNGIIH